MSNLETKAKEPKIFMIADGRDYKYYIDPALEIIRHEGTGTFIYEGNYGHVDIEVHFEPDDSDGFVDYQKGRWRANGITFKFEGLKEMLHNEFCQG